MTVTTQFEEYRAAARVRAREWVARHDSDWRTVAGHILMMGSYGPTAQVVDRTLQAGAVPGLAQRVGWHVGLLREYESRYGAYCGASHAGWPENAVELRCEGCGQVHGMAGPYTPAIVLVVFDAEDYEAWAARIHPCFGGWQEGVLVDNVELTDQLRDAVTR